LVSNRWVIVVEAKLGSGFGETQPWREYLVGKQIAENRGLPGDSVHYLVVTRAIVHGAQVFGSLESHQRDVLEPRTLWFRWLDAVTLVDGWRWRHEAGGRRVPQNEIRMLKDLLGALRRRRTLSFCGFSFSHHQPVCEVRLPIFCPPLFNGFLCKSSVKCDPPPSIGFLARFQGFLRGAYPSVVPTESVWLQRFQGFLRSVRPAQAPSESFFCSPGFNGFLKDAPPCAASATMAGFKKEFFRSACPAVVLMESVWLRRFYGFLHSAQSVHASSEAIFCSLRFKGFMTNAPPCVASATMAGSLNDRRP